METWKTIPGFPDYEVSDLGRVRSHTNHGKGKLMKFRLRGVRVKYWGVSLHESPTVKKQKLVHLLVLETFVGPCPDGQEGRHLNGDPLDAQLSNLAWGTKTENWQDRKDHGRGLGGKKPQGQAHSRASS